MDDVSDMPERARSERSITYDVCTGTVRLQQTRTVTEYDVMSYVVHSRFRDVGMLAPPELIQH